MSTTSMHQTDRPRPVELIPFAMVSMGLLVATPIALQSTSPQATGADSGAAFKPVPLPDPGILGFRFPEAEVTILGWVRDSVDQDPTVQRKAAQQIHLHSWGLWTALNADSGQKYEGQNLRVFETWLTPANVLDLTTAKGIDHLVRQPWPLEDFNQLRNRARRFHGRTPTGEDTVLGFVKYDPTAGEHVALQKLLQARTLNSLIANGKDSVPAFPVTAISLKPVYQPLGSGKLIISDGAPVMQQGRYYPLPVWPGPPQTPAAFPQNLWTTWVWVDVQGGGQGKGEVLTITPPGPPAPTTITPDVTYNLDKFIHFKILSAENVASINDRHKAKSQDLPTLAVNDYAVLLGMHVTTREITQWTWQTFWWLPDADLPGAPSSRAIARDRPLELKRAQRNYAMSHAYSTLLPQQPITGGQNVGDSVYAYNPYLEAAFGPEELPASIPGKTGTKVVANNVGVQTNCMSCHAMACYVPGRTFRELEATLYTGDRYVDQQGPQFRGSLKADFLWSIPVRAK